MPHLYVPPRLRKSEAQSERHATWLELFFDLVFVVAITQLGERLIEHLNFQGLLEFIALFIPVWWAWVGHTVYATRFDTDDIVHRLLTFMMMFAAAIMAVQMPTALAEGATVFSLGYILARVALLLLYARVLFYAPDLRAMSLLYLLGFGLGVSCWVISLFLVVPDKFIFWTLGLIIDFTVPWLGKKNILSHSPLDSSHIPERFGLFTIIVLGETVLAVILGLTHAHWQLLSILASILAFTLAILIWWLYYHYMQIADYKCTLSSGQPFIYMHLPLVISLVVMGVGIEQLIMNAQRPAFLSEANIIFCGSVVLYLISFIFLQRVSLRHVKLKKVSWCYVGGVIFILIAFILPLPTWALLITLDIVFFLLLLIEIRFLVK